MVIWAQFISWREQSKFGGCYENIGAAKLIAPMFSIKTLYNVVKAFAKFGRRSTCGTAHIGRSGKELL